MNIFENNGGKKRRHQVKKNFRFIFMFWIFFFGLTFFRKDHLVSCYHSVSKWWWWWEKQMMIDKTEQNTQRKKKLQLSSKNLFLIWFFFSSQNENFLQVFTSFMFFSLWIIKMWIRKRQTKRNKHFPLKKQICRAYLFVKVFPQKQKIN